jgi:type IV secretory pathway VirJ component
VLAATRESCHPLVGDAENISHQLQRERRSTGYFSPVLAGAGQGGTLAAHALAEAPSNTLAGGLAVDPDAALDPRFKPCPPDPTLSRGSGLPGFYDIAMIGGESNAKPGAETTRTTARTTAHTTTRTTAGKTLGKASGETAGRTGAKGEGKPSAALPASGALRRFAAGTTEADMMLALIEPHLGRANPGEGVQANGAIDKDGNLADLPLIELPAAHPNGLMAVVVSGDGGWRDLDKTIAETLQKKGVSVIGWDSLRYFWRAKTPQQTSRDLARILNTYGARWQVRQVALIGYSFGADILPFAYNRLPPTLRERVSAMALLGFAPNADFQIRVTGWLGLPASDSAIPVAPEIARVPPALIQCFYGQDETDTACPRLAGTAAKVVRTAGGHHFDHDYGQLAADILGHWQRHTSAAAASR